MAVKRGASVLISAPTATDPISDVGRFFEMPETCRSLL